MAADAANALGDVDVAVAAARRGENNCDDHLLELKNSLLAASAESEYALNCLNSLNSLMCHPSMHAPSLARVVDVKHGGFSGMVCGEGVGRVSRGRDTARLDALLHDVIHSVLACGHPRIQGLPEYYDCFYARWRSRTASLRKVGQDAGAEKSGVWFFQNAGGLVEAGTSVAHWRCGLGMEGIVPHSVGGSWWFLVFLFVCVRTGPSRRAAYWRAELATAGRCVEGYRTPDEALVC